MAASFTFGLKAQYITIFNFCGALFFMQETYLFPALFFVAIAVHRYRLTRNGPTSSDASPRGGQRLISTHAGWILWLVFLGLIVILVIAVFASVVISTLETPSMNSSVIMMTG